MGSDDVVFLRYLVHEAVAVRLAETSAVPASSAKLTPSDTACAVTAPLPSTLFN